MLKLLCIPVVAFIFFFADDKKDILVWDQDRLLTWDDFRGKPQRRFAAASTHYDMYKTTEEKGNKAEVKVEAVFLCNKSWKKLNWCSPSVLAHEQKHFDIDELYARKLRKLIKEEKYSSYEKLKTISDSLYNVIDKEMDVYQDKYDDETDGSMNGDKQREWQKKINAEIEALSAYKNTNFTVSISK
jgi:hypothetical protein